MKQSYTHRTCTVHVLTAVKTAEDRGQAVGLMGDEKRDRESGTRRGEDPITKVAQKVTRPPSPEIIFDKFMRNQSNEGHINTDVSNDAACCRA